ncbi:MAG: molybdopterin molybdotransferase MoeA [Tepidisphaeraceae bacterium]
MSERITVAQAISIIDAQPVAPRVVRVSLEQAHGLRLAQDVVADRDYPPFDKSLMDGYVVRSQDLLRSEAVLQCINSVAAGNDAGPAIGEGQCVKIMTGAPMPPGADAVIPVESARADDRGVRLVGPAVKGKYIALRASDCRAGQVVLTRGVSLEAAALAVAASVGAAEVQIFAAPQVAVLATGNELVPFDQQPGPSHIRNSNSIMMVALLRRLGCEVVDLGVVNDDRAAVRAAVARGMEHDVLFVTGGMSMGDFDFVPGVLTSEGVEIKISKLRIKPGKPFVFGVRQEPRQSYVFGLPGNPVSAFACTVRLCRRLLERLAGGQVRERWLNAALTEPLAANGPREFYQPAILHDDSRVTPLAWKGSADIYTLARANALLVRGENEPAQPAGATVRLLEVPS